MASTPHNDLSWPLLPFYSGQSPSFTLFASLPVEIRYTIWQLTLEPRIAEISTSTGILKTECSDPPALRTCRESRAAVLPCYPLCFGFMFQRPTTRFNFSLDTLYVPQSLGQYLPILLSTLKDFETAGLQRLAIDEQVADSDNAYKLLNDIRGMLTSLTGLKEILVACRVEDLANEGQGMKDIGYHLGLSIKFFDELPEELRGSSLRIAPLPRTDGRFPVSNERHCFPWRTVPRSRPVYAWRPGPKKNNWVSALDRERQQWEEYVKRTPNLLIRHRYERCEESQESNGIPL